MPSIQLPLFVPKPPKATPFKLQELEALIVNNPVAIDTETYDPYLKERGPGFKYGEGKVVGVSLSFVDGTSIYYPFNHALSEDNFPKKDLSTFMAKVYSDAGVLVFANASYDLGWIHNCFGLTPKVPVQDVQVNETLLDPEKPSFSLDKIAKSHLGESKDETLLKEAATCYGIDPKAGMWKLPARFIAPYAEKDAYLTRRVYEAQHPLLQDSFREIWELESKVIPICFHMTRKGVRIDTDRAEQVNTRLKKEEAELKAKYDFDIWSGVQIAKFLDKEGIFYPRTEKGNPSITKDFMEQHPKLRELKYLRQINRLREVFIEKTLLKESYKGRIHSDFIQTAREEESGGYSGTVLGRFSSKNPNLQQVPKRSEIGKLIRSLFVADEGTLWASSDFSSQEPRMQVHYALRLGLAGAQEAKEAFAEGKKLYTFLEEKTGISYNMCKDTCLAKSYGAGAKKIAQTLGTTQEKAQEILDLLDKEAPFVSGLFERTRARANSQGQIKTMTGRICYFSYMAPVKPQEFWHWDQHTKNMWEKKHPPLPEKQAYGAYPQMKLERINTYKALNRLIQGSSAEQTKKGMVAAYEAGHDIRLPVHDEINSCVETEKEAKEINDCMENAVELLLPSVCDLEVGASWNDL